MTEASSLKLSDLTRRIKEVITGSFGNQTYWIIAEVSGHKFYPDKDRHYFDLVEKLENSTTETAKVKANSWEQGSRQIACFEKITGQKFTDGLQVLINVTVNYHIVYGLSLTLVDIDPNFTLGNLERQRRETLLRLTRENPDFIQVVDDQYITRNKQLKLNCVIQNIALIGSPRSEGYTDFVHTLNTNNFQYRFSMHYYYSAVQGVNAEQELVKTLLQVYETAKTTPYDCVVITRGGGARTDFLVFDTYALARVVAKFPIPIITGIGHHKDVSIVDLMVHTQTKTPTKAAEFILAHNRAFEESVMRFQQRMIIKTQQILADRIKKINYVRTTLSHLVPGFLRTNRDQLNRVTQSIQNKPLKFLAGNQHELLRAQQKIIRCSSEILHQQDRKLRALYHNLITKPREIASHRKSDLRSMLQLIRIHSNTLLAHQTQYLLHQQSLMRMMSPRNILKKGFAIVSQDEKIITRADQVSIGSPLTITLEETNIDTTVTAKSPSNGKYDV